jgi:hypothetical protein
METTTCTSGKINPFGTAYIGLGQLGSGDCGQRWTASEQECRAHSGCSVYHLPNGARSLGNALEEARGMLSYIKSRYGDPDAAWASYFTRDPPWY